MGAGRALCPGGTAETCAASAVPSGLGLFCSLPTDKSVGYFQASLRDGAKLRPKDRWFLQSSAPPVLRRRRGRSCQNAEFLVKYVGIKARPRRQMLVGRREFCEIRNLRNAIRDFWSIRELEYERMDEWQMADGEEQWCVQRVHHVSAHSEGEIPI